MFDVTDSFHTRQFFKMHLISELIRRELTRFITQKPHDQHLPSGTHRRGHFQANGRHIVQRKWAHKSKSVFASSASVATRGKGAISVFTLPISRTHHHFSLKQHKRLASHGSSSSGSPAATQRAISYEEYRGHILDTASMFYDNVISRGPGDTNTIVT